MDTLSRLNALLQSLRHAPPHFNVTSETIYSVRLTLDPATMKLINADPYLSGRVNAALKKGAKDKNRGAAKRKAALDVVGALESLNMKNNVNTASDDLSNKKKKKKPKRKSVDQPAESKTSRKAKKKQERVEQSSSDETETDTDTEQEEEDEEEREDGEISSDCDDSTTHRAMPRATATLDVDPRQTLASKKRKRCMTEDLCEEGRKRKDARRV